MAARLNNRHQQMVRDKIQASQLINRLEKHIDGEVELSQTQFAAAKFLIEQAIGRAPQAVELSGDPENPVGIGLKVLFGAGNKTAAED